MLLDNTNFLVSPFITASMRDVGLALVTAFISIFIFIFGFDQKNLLGFDKNVILQQVLPLPRLLFASLFIFLPSFVWNCFNYSHIFLLILFLVGVFMFVYYFSLSYYWISANELQLDRLDKNSYRGKLRLKYINSTNKKNIDGIVKNQINTLKEYLPSSTNNRIETNKMLEHLLETMELSLIKYKKPEFFNQYVAEFREILRLSIKYSIDKWQEGLIYQLSYNKMFRWLFYLFKKEDKTDSLIQSQYMIIDTISYILTRLLKGSYPPSLRRFFEELSKYSDSSENLEHTRNFLIQIFQIVFQQQPYSNTFYFLPENWRISKLTLQSKNGQLEFVNKIVQLLCIEYLNWIMEEINVNEKSRNDNQIINISGLLFPDFNRHLWLNILILLIYADDINMLVETKAIAAPTSSNNDADFTLKCSKSFFSELFSKEKLTNILKNLREFKVTLGNACQSNLSVPENISYLRKLERIQELENLLSKMRQYT